MPLLLTARTCWRAGWAVLGLGVVLTVVSTPISTVLFQGRGPGTLGTLLYPVFSTLTFVAFPVGAVLLIGSVLVRHVERLTDALVSSGTIEARFVQLPERPGRRTPDGSVDLDGDLDGVVDHEPGVR